MPIFSQSEGKLVDDRDGRTYKTIVFSIPTSVEGVNLKREWMAENLLYESDQSACYKNNDSYCEAYGRLYNYTTALEACPSGWRVPTSKDWFEVIDLHGGLQNAGSSLPEGGSSQLELLYSGFGETSGYYHGIEKEGYYWNSEDKSVNDAGIIVVQRGTNQIYHDKSAKHHLNTVRCIRETGS